MKKFFKGFKYAFEGLIFTVKTQPNFRFHLVVAFLAILIGFALEINNIEWLFVSLSIALVLTAELINTSIEQLSDAIDKNVNVLIKHAKDTAAAAVLVCAIFSVVVGIVIFVPRIWTLLFA